MARKPLNLIDYRMMFGPRGNNHSALRVTCNPIPENTFDRVVITFGATGVKDYFAAIGTAGFCCFVPRCLQELSGTSPLAVDARRVAEFFQRIVQRDLGTRPKRCGGSVVKKN